MPLELNAGLTGRSSMTLIEFIHKAQEAIEHGQNPDADLLAWDPERDGWSKVGDLGLTPTHVFVYIAED